MFNLQFTGCDGESFGFGGTGKKSTNRQFDTYGEVGILCFFQISSIKNRVKSFLADQRG